jgi:hypothetical protein
MAEPVCLKDRLLIEELMRVWNACHDSGRILSEPGFDAVNSSVLKMLNDLGMEWDVGHGYVFPWTNREHGPFPMTGKKIPKCSKTSLSTDHSWKVVGVVQESSIVIRVVYVCEACSCWTYHEMGFVGYKMANSQDRLAEDEDRQGR